MTVLGFTGGVMYFGSQEMDPTKPIFVRATPLLLSGWF